MAASTMATGKTKKTAKTRFVGERRWVSRISAVMAWAMGLLFFFPVLWMVATSFKTEGSAQTSTPNLHFDGGLDRYREVMKKTPGTLTFFKSFTELDASALGTSMFVVLVSTFVVLLMAIPAAYALSIRPIHKWRDVLLFFISTKFLPIAAAILPLYAIFRKFALLDTRLGLVIVYTSMNLPLAVWMLRSFFSEVPRELIEAAEIDGASFMQRVTRILLPIVGPGISATALLCFIFAWNEFFLAVNLTTFRSQTIPIWVTTMISTRGQFLAKLSAASTLACLPVVIAGWAAQKRLVRGLTMGAVK
jgi:sorbitol/mannitol transport system permease protein